MDATLEQIIITIKAYTNKTFYHNKYGETLSGNDAFENMIAIGMGRTSTKEVLFYAFLYRIPK